MKLSHCASIVATFIAPCILASQVFAQAPASPPVTPWPKDDAGLKTLGTTLIKDWFAKIVANDASGVAASMQPCMQLVAFDGATDFALSMPRIVAIATKSPEITDVIATRCGDALVTTCLVAAGQVFEGESLSKDAVARIGVWQFVDGSWKIAAWASLSMPATRPATSAPKFPGDATLNAEGQAMLAKFLKFQQTKDMKPFDAMLADGMQVVNFKGQLVRADLIKGASRAKTQPAVITDARATRCGDLTVVSCNLSMGQTVGFTSLPADSVPFIAVFQGTGDTAKVIAIGNTNKPK